MELEGVRILKNEGRKIKCDLCQEDVDEAMVIDVKTQDPDEEEPDYFTLNVCEECILENGRVE